MSLLTSLLWSDKIHASKNLCMKPSFRISQWKLLQFRNWSNYRLNTNRFLKYFAYMVIYFSLLPFAQSAIFTHFPSLICPGLGSIHQKKGCLQLLPSIFPTTFYSIWDPPYHLPHQWAGLYPGALEGGNAPPPQVKSFAPLLKKNFQMLREGKMGIFWVIFDPKIWIYLPPKHFALAKALSMRVVEALQFVLTSLKIYVYALWQICT